MPADPLAVSSARLGASIGGYRDSFRVEGDGTRLVYERFAQTDEPCERREHHPTVEAWATFWREVEDAGVWGWKRIYEPEDPIMDGTSWGLSLSDGRRIIESSGSNVGPPGLGAVCHAISRLVGERFR